MVEIEGLLGSLLRNRFDPEPVKRIGLESQRDKSS